MLLQASKILRKNPFQRPRFERTSVHRGSSSDAGTAPRTRGDGGAGRTDEEDGPSGRSTNNPTCVPRGSYERTRRSRRRTQVNQVGRDRKARAPAPANARTRALVSRQGRTHERNKVPSYTKCPPKRTKSLLPNPTNDERTNLLLSLLVYIGSKGPMCVRPAGTQVKLGDRHRERETDKQTETPQSP